MAPECMPLPGVGCFLRHTAGNVSMILAVPIRAFLSNGISLPDMPTYMATDSGAKLFTETAVVLYLETDTVAWIPYRWVAWPLK